jgi:hypothetical protein
MLSHDTCFYLGGTPLRHAFEHTLMPLGGWNWRLDRVYFLASFNPSREQPDPALTARLDGRSQRRATRSGNTTDLPLMPPCVRAIATSPCLTPRLEVVS